MATAIVDGNYLLHRVMKIPNVRVLATKDGKPTGGTFGVLKSLRATLFKFSEIRSMVVVFDGGHSPRRKKIHPGYKVRSSSDEELDPDGLSYKDKFVLQLRQLQFILTRLGVKVVTLPGKEGDDVVGLLSKTIKDNLRIVISDDKDMFQLVTDGVHLWRPLAEERVTLSNFEETAGCKYEHWFLKKSILGDTSDKIPGVKTVGEKTVDKLLLTCPNIGPYPWEKFFEEVCVVGGKKCQALLDNIGTVLRNYDLIDISKEEFTPAELEYVLTHSTLPSQFDVRSVYRIFGGFEFYSLVDDFNQWVVPFQMLR